MMNRKVVAVILSGFLMACGPVSAQVNKTVIGPTNAELADGANELLAGNAKEGVRLSLLGLNRAIGRDDKVAGLSNICVGYIMLDELDKALVYCDRALALDDSHWRALCNRALAYIKLKRYDEAEADIERGMVIAPDSSKLKTVRRLLLDATHPVEQNVIIDDSWSGNYDAQDAAQDGVDQTP